MPKPSIIVVGSSNTDMIVKVDRLPRSGETILGGEFSSASGGKGANQAVAASRAGGAVTFIARVGNDAFGLAALAALRANGVNTDEVATDRSDSSGVALIFVAKSGQNSIAVAPGANRKLLPPDVRKSKHAFRDASVVLLQLETPLQTAQAAAELGNAVGARVILNPAPAQKLSARLFENLYLITPNENEAELLTGITVDSEAAAAKAAAKLLALGVQNVIITMGASGAFVAAAGIRQFIEAHKVTAVDATGAGDVFNGSLAVAVAEGKSLLEAAAFANAAAALSVMRLGAQASAPDRKLIDQLLATSKSTRRSAVPSVISNGQNGHNGWNGLSARRRKKPIKILTEL